MANRIGEITADDGFLGKLSRIDDVMKYRGMPVLQYSSVVLLTGLHQPTRFVVASVHTRHGSMLNVELFAAKALQKNEK